MWRNVALKRFPVWFADRKMAVCGKYTSYFICKSADVVPKLTEAPEGAEGSYGITLGDFVLVEADCTSEPYYGVNCPYNWRPIERVHRKQGQGAVLFGEPCLVQLAKKPIDRP